MNRANGSLSNSTNPTPLNRLSTTHFKETHHGQIFYRLAAGRARICAGHSVVFLLMASHPDPSAEPQREAPEKGQTLPQRNEQPEPRLPHERDESSDSHPGTDDERIQQAARDLEAGQQDTGRSPVVTELARKEFPSQSDKTQGARKKKHP